MGTETSSRMSTTEEEISEKLNKFRNLSDAGEQREINYEDSALAGAMGSETLSDSDGYLVLDECPGSDADLESDPDVEESCTMNEATSQQDDEVKNDQDGFVPVKSTGARKKEKRNEKRRQREETANSDENLRSILYFPKDSEITFTRKLKWALDAAKNLPQYRIEYIDGKYSDYVKVNNDAVGFLTSVGHDGIKLVEPQPNEKHTKIIIKRVPLELDLKHIEENCNVVWTRRNKVRGESRNQVIALFKGEVPDFINIPGLPPLPTDVYREPPLFCYKCCSWGHKAWKCQRSLKCAFCGDPHDSKFCREKIDRGEKIPPKCANCRGAHNAMSTLCHHNPINQREEGSLYAPPPTPVVRDFLPPTPGKNDLVHFPPLKPPHKKISRQNTDGGQDKQGSSVHLSNLSGVNRPNDQENSLEKSVKNLLEKCEKIELENKVLHNKMEKVVMNMTEIFESLKKRVISGKSDENNDRKLENAKKDDADDDADDDDENNDDSDDAVNGYHKDDHDENEGYIRLIDGSDIKKKNKAINDDNDTAVDIDENEENKNIVNDIKTMLSTVDKLSCKDRDNAIVNAAMPRPPRTIIFQEKLSFLDETAKNNALKWINICCIANKAVDIIFRANQDIYDV